MSSDAESFHRRHLPHLYLPNAVYFTTFRLAGSLPRLVIDELQEKSRLQKKSWMSFVDYDKALEKCKVKARWLANWEIADMVAESIRLRDGNEYDLAAYCIMPNHVHMIFGVGNHDLFNRVGQIVNLSDKPLSKIMQSLKRYTAGRANHILRRSGPFWQDESFDHVLRNEEEFERTVRYVVYNPVKAGMVRNWRDWRWTFSVFDLD
ncbi:MAG TPA: transposase [Bacteroidota bacterium]